MGRHELGRDLGVEHRLQHRGLGVVDALAVRDHPADDVLDEGLRHAGVDGVVAHLVADAVGRPAERELRQVGRADDHAAVLVREPEEEVGADAGLDVLERDVVERLAVARTGGGCPRGSRSRRAGCRSSRSRRRPTRRGRSRSTSCARSSRSPASCRRGCRCAAVPSGPSRARPRGARASSRGRRSAR